MHGRNTGDPGAGPIRRVCRQVKEQLTWINRSDARIKIVRPWHLDRGSIKLSITVSGLKSCWHCSRHTKVSPAKTCIWSPNFRAISGVAFDCSTNNCAFAITFVVTSLDDCSSFSSFNHYTIPHRTRCRPVWIVIMLKIINKIKHESLTNKYSIIKAWKIIIKLEWSLNQNLQCLNQCLIVFLKSFLFLRYREKTIGILSSWLFVSL